MAWLYRAAERHRVVYLATWPLWVARRRACRAPCNWPGCQARQASGFPFCPRCYSRLPKGLRMPLSRTWDGMNDDDALQALQDALDYARGWQR